MAQPIAENAFGRSTRLLKKIVGLENEVARHQIAREVAERKLAVEWPRLADQLVRSEAILKTLEALPD